MLFWLHFFKFLMPAYVEEHNASLQAFVLSTLRIWEGCPGDENIPLADRRETSQGLQKLYGSRFRKSCWPCSVAVLACGCMSHDCQDRSTRACRKLSGLWQHELAPDFALLLTTRRPVSGRGL